MGARTRISPSRSRPSGTVASAGMSRIATSDIRRAAPRRTSPPTPSRSCHRSSRRFLAGSRAALLPPSNTQVKTEGSRRCSAVATSETCVTRPDRPSSSTVSASKPGSTTTGVAVRIERVTTASPPMCARGKQASQVCLDGSTSSRFDVALADAPIASWVSTTPLGCCDVPEVATTSASPSSTGSPPLSACCSPSEVTIRVGLRASSTVRRASSGSRGSRGAAASPVSHMA